MIHMNWFKKFALILLLFLIAYSIKEDLTNSMQLNHSIDAKLIKQESSEQSSFQVVGYHVKDQDTFISLIDQFNPDITNFNMKKIEQDFFSLNPNVESTNLQTGTYYLFPKY